MSEQTLDRLINDGAWRQFQFYGWFPEEPEGKRAILMLTGDITRTLWIPGKRIACFGNRELRASGDAWEDVTTDEPFEVPGMIERVHHTLTPLGRLLMVSQNPRETVITVLFPEDGRSLTETLERFGVLTMLDLSALTVVPRHDQPRPKPLDLRFLGDPGPHPAFEAGIEDDDDEPPF